MDTILKNIEHKKDLYRVYIATLFFAIHAVLVTYINSTFLEGFVSAKVVGILYTIGAIFGLVTLSYTPHILRTLGNKGLMISFAILEISCLAIIALSDRVLIVITVFAIHQALRPALFVSFDVFIEHFSTTKTMGQARGTFLSIINSAYVAIPMLTGFILSFGSFPMVYALSAILIIPMIISIYSIKNFSDSDYQDTNLLSSIKKSRKNKNIYSIIKVNTVLHMFYAIMIIYIPIYLHEYIGFSWAEIGIMFTIMLTPFVLFELPLGKLSDTLLGEKEILMTGITILGISSTLIPFIKTDSIIVWTIVLFSTRIGASFIEIMSDSYFFKKIKDDEAPLLSLWRSLEHFSYIIIPSIISLLLFIIGSQNLKYIFLIIPIIAFIALKNAYKIKDTL